MGVWQTPDSYFGFDPVGHTCVIAVNRDSDALARTNWDAACARIAEACDMSDIPEHNGSPLHETPSAYQWEATHWAVGWIRYLMVRLDNVAGLAEADAIAKELDDYPALDEMAWSDLEHEEASDYWARASVRARLDILKASHSDASRFSARRAWLPDDSGYVQEYLNGC